MKKLLIILLFVSTPAFAQFGSKRVRVDTLVSFRDTAFVIVNDSLRVVNYVELDSVKTPPCPPQGRINLLSRGVSGIFVQFSNCNQTRLDSTWDSVRVAHISDSLRGFDSTKYKFRSDTVSGVGYVRNHQLNDSTSALRTDLTRKSTTITINGTTNQIISSAGAQDLSANRTWTLSTPQNIDTAAHVQFEQMTLSQTSATPRFFFRGPGSRTIEMAFSANQLFFYDSAGSLNTLLTLNDSLNTIGVRSPPANIDGLKLDATGLPNNPTGAHGFHGTYTVRGIDTAEAHISFNEGYLRNTNIASELTGYGAFVYRDSAGVGGSVTAADFHAHEAIGTLDSGTAALALGIHTALSNTKNTLGLWIWSGNHSTISGAKSAHDGLLISGGVSGAGGFHYPIRYLLNDSATLTKGTVGFLVDSLGDVFSLPLTNKAVLYSNAGTISPLAVNSTATKKYVQQFSSGTPTLAQVDFADLSGSASLTTQVTGILPTANGGTGAGTFIAGAIPFVGTPSGIYRADTSLMFIDSATGNIGIGTSLPDNAFTGRRVLDMTGGSVNGALIQLKTLDGLHKGYLFASSGTPGAMTIGSRTSDNFQIRTKGAVRATFDTLGNVGIGTTAPGQLLDVAGKFQATSTGSVAKVNNVATAGTFGVGAVIHTWNGRNTTANGGAGGTDTAASVAGRYLVSYCISVHTTGTAGSTASLSFIWTGLAGTAITHNSATITLTTATGTNHDEGSFLVSHNGTAVLKTVTAFSSAGGSPTYDFDVVFQALDQ